MITEDIEKIDLVVDRLFNFVKVSIPMRKTNTVHTLIEEMLQKFENRLEEKKIKVFKRFEKDLPETTLPDPHLRYILNSILQYAVTCVPSHGTLGLLTQSFVVREPGQDPTLLKNGRGYVGITLFFTGDKKCVESWGTELKIGTTGREEWADLLLQLVKEVAHRNRGVMKIKVDEKEAKIDIVLEFPVERRATLYYQN